MFGSTRKSTGGRTCVRRSGGIVVRPFAAKRAPCVCLSQKPAKGVHHRHRLPHSPPLVLLARPLAARHVLCLFLVGDQADRLLQHLPLLCRPSSRSPAGAGMGCAARAPPCPYPCSISSCCDLSSDLSHPNPCCVAACCASRKSSAAAAAAMAAFVERRPLGNVLNSASWEAA